MSEPAADKQPRTKRRLSLSAVILIGLVLGLLFGVTVGEYAASLQFIGDAFIALLQMTVLPYVILALVINIGGLTVARARLLATRAGLMLLAFWGLGLVFVVVLPLSLPELTNASFFSTSLLEPARPVDYLSLYIPSNPFRALANNLVPAIVLFSIVTGVALIGVPGKDKLIEPLKVLLEALGRINTFMVKITPIGVFALTASAAGTSTTEEIGRLQAYLITYVAAALLLTFLVLPAIVASLTPFPRREVMRSARDALATAFATNNVFVVLPLLAENAKRLFEQGSQDSTDVAPSIDVVLPVAFTFPSLGKLMTLLFIPFAAWFVGSELELVQYPQFIVSGLMSYFGSLSLAVPFLLDLMNIPADLFQLFLLAGLFCGRFGALMTAMYLLCFTVMTTCAMTGSLRVRLRPLMGYMVLTAVILAGLVISVRAYLDRAMEGAYYKDKIILAMQLLDDPVPATVLDHAAPNPVPLEAGQSRLDRIHRRGVLRVGYLPDNLPWSYSNAGGTLVGFDVAMAHQMADDLGVSLEFVPFEIGAIGNHLDEDHFDLAMSGIVLTPYLYGQALVSEPYLDVTPCIVVEDHRRNEFSSLEKALAMEDLVVGVHNDQTMIARIRTGVPDATIVGLDSLRPFFDGTGSKMDALLTNAETGSAWTLLYPRFGIANTRLRAKQWPLGYPIAGHDLTLEAFVNAWLDHRRKAGMIQEIYDYWILGHSAEPEEPRWSVIRDVLHLVD